MADQIDSHLEAIRKWIDSRAAGVLTSPDGLTSDERTQLRAVDRSVQQLQKLGVSVPDDLRQLKLRLSSKQRTTPPADNLHERAAEVEQVVEQLSELLKTAKQISRRLSSDTSSPGTKKHFGIKLGQLVRAKLLSPEDRLELQWLKDGPQYEGKVTPDGKVKAKTNLGWKTFPSLSTAAQAIADKSLNGWDCWYRIESDGRRTKLGAIRERFITGRSG